MDASKKKYIPIITGISCTPPFLAGLIVEYLVCRLTRRRWWKLPPPVAAAALTAAVAVGRAGVWESSQSPLTQLLSVSGSSALFALLSLLAGWRPWKRLWGPWVVKDKGACWMYLHLGQGVVVPYWDVLVLSDLDNTSASHLICKFLERVEQAGQVVSMAEDLSKSFVLYRPAGGEATVYLFQLSTATLLWWAENNSFE